MADETPPPSTADIASQTLESLEHDQPTPESSPEPAAETSAAEPSQATAGSDTPAEVSEAEALLREAGYQTEKKPDGRFHYIPRWKVVQMVESGLKKRTEALSKERESWKGEKEMLAKAADEARQFRHLMEHDPQALMHRLAALDARYKAFLGNGQHQQAQAAAAALPSDQDPEPMPDVDLGNGRATYSLDGIRKLREWDRRQLERSFDQKLQPYHERLQAEQEHAQRQRAEHQLRERTTAIVDKVKTWPRFAEHEATILDILQKDTAESQARGVPPQKSVYDAYIEAVVPKLAGDHNSVREQVLRELNGAPKSTSVGANGAEATRNPGPRTTQEIARRTMAQLEGRG